LTGAFGWWLIRRSRRTAFTPPLAVLIPAHNEAHGIAKTIMAVDEAARTYPGQIHAYIVDNASIDGTYQAARGALAACTRISGSVIQCHQPGKAVALNYGLARIEEDFVVRIDADTVIGDRCLATAMRHFANANVGSVGGMPRPAHERTLIDTVRLVEVLMRHGFYQVALFSFDGVLGVPGMFSVYRRRVLMEVGGIAEGMNGEDVDICLRMSQAGYHVVHDPAAQYYSETPDSYSHLREQRVRWFRSLYHIVANNRQVVLDHRSITGTIVLPFMLANSARRAMLAPILVFAMFIAVIFRYNFVDLRWQPLLATVVGIPALMSVLICLLWRRPRALLYLPAYLGFRVLRSYLTLAAILTLVFPPTDSPLRAMRRWWNRDAPPLRRNGIPAGRLSTSR
ncbi:MAG: glycosyltransferase family 2 protein, partial [Dietzia sp.]|nr:glycosyltransferase family 2 protein [Dietzia sp.]